MTTAALASADLPHVEAASGVTYAYRRFGTTTGLPGVLLQHYRGRRRDQLDRPVRCRRCHGRQRGVNRPRRTT
jgi:hypothetical protein